MTTAMNFDIGATDRASATFLRVARAAERLERKLKDLDRTNVSPTIKLDTRQAEQQARRFMTRLRGMGSPAPKVKIDVDIPGKGKVDDLKTKLTALRNKKIKVELDVADAAGLTTLSADLAALSNAKVKVELEVADSAQLTALQTALGALTDTKVKIEMDIVGAADVAALTTALLDLESLSPVKVKVEVDDQATADLTAISALANALATASPTVQVDADTAAALAQLAAVAAAMGALGTGSTTVRVVLDQLTFLGQLARVQSELRTLAGGSIEINADTRRLMEELARVRVELANLQQQTPSVVVDADTALARHRIQQLEEELARIAGRQYNARVDVDVDKGAVERIASLGKNIIALGAAGTIAAGGIGSITAAVGSLLASLSSLAGLAPIAVGALASLAVVGGTVKLATIGMGDAMKAIADGKMDKFAEATAKMSAEGKKFAEVLNALKGPFDGLRRSLQDDMFAGLNKSLVQLASTYIPLLKSGLGSLAGELNGMAKDFVKFATSAQSVRDVDTIFRNTTEAMRNARPAATNLLEAFRDIAVVGTSMLPQMATGFTNATARFRDFIAAARESGQLQVWIQNGVDSLQRLGAIAGNIGGSLGAVFTAARASGADFLTTLERVTQSLEDMLRSAQGQAALTALFSQFRATIDALLPGLKSVGEAALRFIQAFAETGGLQRAGEALTAIGQAVAPLGAQLGQLAGNTLRALAAGARTAADALTPIVSAIGAVLNALGPVTPAVLAMVIAFKSLQGVGVAVAAAGASVAAFAGRVGASATATAGITTAFTRLGGAIPIVGAAVIALGIAFDGARPKTDEWAASLNKGQMSIEELKTEIASSRSALSTLLEGQNAWTDVNELNAESLSKVRAEAEKQISAMEPLAAAQARANLALADYNQSVRDFSADSPQAAAAFERLVSANGDLEEAQRSATIAAQSHTDAIKAQADTMNTQIGSMLAYEEAVRRTAEAHKAAAEALKKGGKDSADYQQAVGDLTRSISAQADAARRQGEAWGGTEAGIRAYNTELLKAADLSTQAGRDAFVKLAGALDNAGLKALSAQAQMSGLKTEIMTLPDGRKVTVVVAADQKDLNTVKQSVAEFVGKEYIGTVRLNGDDQDLNGVIVRALRFANGSTGVMRISAESGQAEVVIAGTKYKIDSTTGIMTIDGDAAPGEADLSGLKLKTDSTTGVMTIEADTGPADNKLSLTVQKADGSTGTITIEGNPTPAGGKITSAVRLADGSTGTITIEANRVPADGKINATIRYADGSTGTVTINARDLATPVIDKLKLPTSSTHTIRVVTTQVGPQYQSGNTTVLGHDGMIVQPMARGGVLGMASGGRLSPMSSRVATVVPPNTWRVIGDRVTNDEAFIPINNSARSMAILQSTAARMGQTVSPQASGGLNTSSTLWRAMPSYATARGGGDQQAQVAAVLAAIRRELRDTLAVLRERAVNITVEDRSGNPTETARATQLAIRTS